MIASPESAVETGEVATRKDNDPAETASTLRKVPAETSTVSQPVPMRQRRPHLFTTRHAAMTFARCLGHMSVRPAGWWFAAIPDELRSRDADRVVDRLVLQLSVETGSPRVTPGYVFAWCYVDAGEIVFCVHRPEWTDIGPAWCLSAGQFRDCLRDNTPLTEAEIERIEEQLGGLHDIRAVLQLPAETLGVAS